MWALIVNNMVIEITHTNPTDRYHPDILCLAVNDDIQVGWSYYDGVFRSPVDYTAIEEAERKRNPVARKVEVDTIRMEHEILGRKWNFNGKADVIQTRNEKDYRNLQWLATKAANSLDDTKITLPFRAESDDTYYLTPKEMYEMCESVFDHFTALYEYGWGLKEQIDLLADKPEELAVLDLTTGWPE